MEPLIYDLSSPGRVGAVLPESDVPHTPLPEGLLRAALPLPEVSQIDVTRHFTRLSRLNMGIDTNMYPLGSCTMKYNPRINEDTARMAGFALAHPLQDPDVSQGAMYVLYQLQQFLAEIAGMDVAFATRDCPLGFTRDAADAEHVVCERKDGADVLDRVVLVGNGPASYWIDQYEASLWDAADKKGKSYDGDYPVTFPKNGQVTSKAGLLFARSVPDVSPSASVTWFQASLGCLASGKRLPSGREWQAAATGTGDLKGVPSADCNIATGLKRSTKSPMGCVSLWGAEDMIGNVGEMLAELRMGPNNGGIGAEQAQPAWGLEYGNAVDYSLASFAVPDVGASAKQGLPAVEVRGGTFGVMNVASVFQISVSFAPSVAHPDIGFRCVIPR